MIISKNKFAELEKTVELLEARIERLLSKNRVLKEENAKLSEPFMKEQEKHNKQWGNIFAYDGTPQGVNDDD